MTKKLIIVFALGSALVPGLGCSHVADVAKPGGGVVVESSTGKIGESQMRSKVAAPVILRPGMTPAQVRAMLHPADAPAPQQPAGH